MGIGCVVINGSKKYAVLLLFLFTKSLFTNSVKAVNLEGGFKDHFVHY